MAVKRKANPMRTKTDKVRLGPLSLVQLQSLFDKANRGKDKDKIQRRMATMFKRGLSLPVEETAEV